MRGFYHLSDRCEQGWSVEGLLKESLVALRNRSPSVGRFVTAGDEKDGQLRARASRQSLQLEAIHVRHADVGNEAVYFRQAGVFQQLFGGRERSNGVTGGLQQFL